MTIKNMLRAGYTIPQWNRSRHDYGLFPKHLDIHKDAETHESKTNSYYSFTIRKDENNVMHFSCNIGNGDVNDDDVQWLATYFNIKLPVSDEYSII